MESFQISLRIISIHSKFAMKIRNGGGLFFCTPRLCRRSVTSSTCTNFVLGYIGGGYYFAVGSEKHYFVHTNSSFFGLSPVFRETILKKTIIVQQGAALSFWKNSCKHSPLFSFTGFFLVTKLGSKRVPKYEVV